MCQPKFLPEPEAPLVGYGSRVRLPTGNRSRTISLQELMEHFHLPINEAACKLGVCVTVLKQQCREHGIQRWPFRKVRKLDNMLHALENSTPPERLRPFALTNGEEERKRKIDTVKGALCQLLVDPNSSAHLKIGKLKGAKGKDAGTRETTSAVSLSSSLEMSASPAKSTSNEAAMFAKPSSFYGSEESLEENAQKPGMDRQPVELDLLSRVGCNEESENVSASKGRSVDATSDPTSVSGITDVPAVTTPSLSSAEAHQESVVQLLQPYETGQPALKRPRVASIEPSVILPIARDFQAAPVPTVPVNPWALIQGFPTGLVSLPFLVAGQPPVAFNSAVTGFTACRPCPPSVSLF
ncbi:hypothetical protein CLOM_g16577 [Closterium sp. NIES-68]|nr:hypothetical protein CLOM_g16577 [Closterium sp. NIES-68]GJP69323.1 hypothetical protein CLOP_g261 [Closterium sp. NIES-67]